MKPALKDVEKQTIFSNIYIFKAFKFKKKKSKEKCLCVFCTIKHKAYWEIAYIIIVLQL